MPRAATTPSPRTAPNRGLGRIAPPPNSPANLLRLFEWCYDNKAIAEYRELFTEDYVFYFSPLDSTGQPFKERGWRREDELISTTHLFVGGSADQPPADRIELTLDAHLNIQRDPYYADTDPQGRWHKQILTDINLQIHTPDDTQIVHGPVTFFVIRGDLAIIPSDLPLRPDSTRWYIRQLNDDTIHSIHSLGAALARGSGPAGLAPTTRWGALKAAYSR